MQQLKEIKTLSNVTERANAYREWFLENGYLHNDITGWEKIETFERFNLDPNMKGVPAQLYQDYEMKQRKVTERDLLGNKIGTKNEFEKVYKDSYHIGASKNFLAYKEWKRKKDKEDMARDFNTPTFN